MWYCVNNGDSVKFPMLIRKPEVQRELPEIREWTWDNREAPFHLAAKIGRFDYVKTFVENGVDVNSYTDISGHTKHVALDLAMVENHHEIISYLVSRGANPDGVNFNYKDGSEWTTLLKCVHEKDFQGFRLMLQLGADPNIVGVFKSYLYGNAKYSNFDEICKLFSDRLSQTGNSGKRFRNGDSSRHL